ncbi:glycoside hydrolase family 127 protein [Dysgonomonas sp. Marseille-P4677]|uniref:glycoside hydrolase family 127 protein n=1 Tax=Dysgonomonas sp. Marseille-P4677 TaxID=2364790 RepID=UPI0019133083|nr:glycoside hydrolase family 127 protein [Dysgonomonas sp. Marseille-P4677]MBK5721909.1 glycoside hydrolase family 127 protein [Dysgonomonas sp. Marseille-P4677]
MKRVYIIAGFVVCTLCMNAQLKKQVDYFNLQDVKLLDSPFKHAEDLDKQYLLELKADRLLAPFLREAGLPLKAESYTNWENTGLDGHIGGHYLSALSLMYASTGDIQIKERLDYMINELKRCQDANANGYIGGVPGGRAIWNEVANGNIKAGGFDLNGKWVPLYNIHKTYAGLRDAYLYTHNNMAKDMLIKMTDWAINLVSKLSEEQIQDMLRSEHGGLNETFADVAAITGDEKYLKLAHQFSHHLVLNPLLEHEDKLTGMHANTQIPKVLGFKRIADVEGNESWSEASRFFWETVVEHRSVCIGGNSVGEHFNPTNDFSRVIKSIEGPETCNTYNMLRLSKMLYQTSKDEKYMDYYERALYNHILSTQNPKQGGFVYFTQMRPGHYRVYSQPQTSFWCCVGSGIENHAKYGEMIYAHTDDELYVNLFIPSRVKWEAKKTEIIQENIFPDEAKTCLTINPEKATNFTLQLRYPKWVKRGTLKVTVNGKNYPVSEASLNYIAINRKWKKGDKVVMEMPMHLTVEQLPDKSNYYSIFYGPIALAAKTGTEDMVGLFADDSRGGHIAHGKQIPMKDMPIIVSDPDKITSLITPVKDKPLTFHLSGLYPSKYDQGLELIPFFRLHESRYIIYWAQATTDGVKDIQRQIEIDEQERIKLDAITIDKVVCGEQQPESDHFIQSDNSRTGFIEDIHWREAHGWFSYKMKNTGKTSKFLYLKYFDRDHNRNFDVLINNQKVATIKLKGRGGDNLFTATYLIPQDEQQNDVLEIKIMASSQSMTTKIAEIRCLSEDM